MGFLEFVSSRLASLTTTISMSITCLFDLKEGDKLGWII